MSTALPSSHPLNLYNCSFHSKFGPRPTAIRHDLRPPCTRLLKIGQDFKLKWTNLKRDFTVEERKAISELPLRMANRCKAVLKRLICVPGQGGEGENVQFLLGAWVKNMKPRRADWLAVLKELKRMQHPLYTEVIDYALLDDSFEANVRDFTKLIHTLGEQNNLERAERTLNSMKRRGFSCDVIALTALINMYSKGGNLRRAKEMFDEIKLLSLNYDKRAYGSMIMAYVRADMLQEAECLIKESETEEIYTGREIYKALLRAYSNKGDSKGAQRVFDSIQFARIVPDSKICALLINAYCLAGQTDEARCVIENMRRAGLKPCERCLSLMIDAYEKDNRLDKALDFLTEMERDNVAVPQYVFGVLHRWFDRIGAKEEMYEVLKEVSL